MTLNTDTGPTGKDKDGKKKKKNFYQSRLKYTQPADNRPSGVLFVRHSPLPFIRRSSLALLIDDNLVVHAKFALWHSTKVALHHNPARHVGAQDLACAGGKREFINLKLAGTPSLQESEEPSAVSACSA